MCVAPRLRQPASYPWRTSLQQRGIHRFDAKHRGKIKTDKLAKQRSRTGTDSGNQDPLNYEK